MMAAYIVAIRGTIGQAVLLGVCAALSHSLIVWIVAMLGLSLGREILTSHFEAWLLIASGVIILGIAAWMLWRTGQSLGWFDGVDHHGHEHHGHGDHHHHDEIRTIDTGHGVVELSIFEDGVPPRWRLRTVSGRMEGRGRAGRDRARRTARERFRFVERDGYLESAGEIPEPHDFTARLRLSHGDHAHTYKVTFAEHDHDRHDHAHHDEDAHEREHAEQIARQLAANGGNVTTGQIALFGITGGLIPCPASITVLLICLQLGQFTLGAATVAAFSLGLAITMVSIGVAAAWGVHHASKRINLSDRLLRRLPLASAGLVGVLGVIMLVQGVVDFASPATALS